MLFCFWSYTYLQHIQFLQNCTIQLNQFLTLPQVQASTAGSFCPTCNIELIKKQLQLTVFPHIFNCVSLLSLAWTIFVVAHSQNTPIFFSNQTFYLGEPGAVYSNSIPSLGDKVLNLFICSPVLSQCGWLTLIHLPFKLPSKFDTNFTISLFFFRNKQPRHICKVIWSTNLVACTTCICGIWPCVFNADTSYWFICLSLDYSCHPFFVLIYLYHNWYNQAFFAIWFPIHFTIFSLFSLYLFPHFSCSSFLFITAVYGRYP